MLANKFKMNLEIISVNILAVRTNVETPHRNTLNVGYKIVDLLTVKKQK